MCPVIFQEIPGLDNISPSIRPFVTAVAQPRTIQTILPGRPGSLEVALGRMLSASNKLSPSTLLTIYVPVVAITLGDPPEATPTGVGHLTTMQWPADGRLADGRSLLMLLTSQIRLTFNAIG